ncbi:MAG: fused MFS/spermidine synthase [Candidatus Ratteibacteria bacterium]|nr:fused MFS/spermidine synthase [Candidatus Ratteibacteria bacterium]
MKPRRIFCKNFKEGVGIKMHRAGISHKNMHSVFLLLFFFSGASALIYQVIWARMLGLLFGLTVFAVSTVLSAFMAGLAFGSLYFGRLSDRQKNPLKLFAYLEISIGIFALLFPFLLSGLTELYIVIHKHLHTSFYLFGFIRFLLAFLLLLIPTTLMGGTLPVLSTFFVKKLKELGWNIGSLYSVNNFGAVAGCLLAGFFLIQAIGVRWTLYLAAVINILIGIIGLSLSKNSITEHRKEAEALSEIDEPAIKENGRIYPNHIIYLVLWVFAIEGFTSLAYEVVWMRILLLFLDNSIYNFAIIVTSFICGLAMGSFWMARFVDRKKNLLALLGFIEIGIGLTAVLILLLFGALLSVEKFRFHFISAAAQEVVSSYILSGYIYSFFIMLIPACLMGATFPLVGKIYAGNLKKLGRWIGNLGCLDSIGAIFGSFVAGFIFIPWLGLQKSIILIAFINIVLGILIFIFHPSISHKTKYSLLGGLIIFIGVVVNVQHEIRFYSLEPGERLIYYKEGAYATVTVLEKTSGVKMLKLNNIEEVPTDYASLQTFHMLGHLPCLLHKNPQKGLVICFGGGITSGAVTTHALRQIDAIEISPEMAKASDYFLEENQNVLSDTRVNLIIEDARNYLLTTENRYDVIICDATHPASSDSWTLYTKEFYELCREKLNEGGIICQWLPLHSLVPSDYKTIVKTFNSVFPHTSLWLPTGYTLMLGAPKKLEIDFASVTKRLQDEVIRKDLQKFHIGDPFAFLSCFVMKDAIAKYVAGVPVNTDDYTPIQFAWKRQVGVSTTPLNMRELNGFRQNIFPLLTNVGKDIENTETKFNIYFKAKGYSILGEIFAQEYMTEEMLRQYQKALYINPDDESTKYLFKKGIQIYLGEGGFQQQAGRYEDALAIYKKVLEIDPDCAEALAQIGSAYIEMGRYEEAVSTIKKAIEMAPDLAIAYNNLGAAYRRMGMNDNATDAFRKATEKDNAYATPYYNLADIYSETGKVEQAIEALQTAIKIDPNQAAFRYNLAKIYFQNGKLNEAINELNVVVKLSPQWIEARYNLAIAYINTGRYGEAKIELKKILKIDPRVKFARETLNALEN